MTEKQGRGRPRAELSMDEIGEKVLEELNRRLSSTRDAAEIPGTQLVQIAQRYLAHLEAQRREEEGEDKHYTPLELIDKPGLALEIRYQILYDYLDEIEATWRECSDRIREMRIELGIDQPEEVNDGDDSTVSE